MRPVLAPTTGNDWLALTSEALPVGDVYEWAGRPDCGAIVLFSGTVRDHAEGRDGVEHLTYEAYEEAVVPQMAAIAAEARRRWPMIGRIALLHRTGRLELGESSVLAVVSTPHRPEAFEAARFAIDALKASVPIWKHETWRDGSAWGTGATPISSRRVRRGDRRHRRAPLTTPRRRGPVPAPDRRAVAGGPPARRRPRAAAGGAGRRHRAVCGAARGRTSWLVT
jgi:molybdopterin synthase catalytic subunit